jgi:hypothetical protein
VKKNGKENKRILNGTTEAAKSDFTKTNKGEINQKGIINNNDVARKIRKYFLVRLKKF